VKHKEKRYGRETPWTGDSGERDRLGLALPNLPYLIHGEVKITETAAILRYIAVTWADRLLGASRRERALQVNNREPLVC
jgi:glutathione S-transferase